MYLTLNERAPVFQFEDQNGVRKTLTQRGVFHFTSFDEDECNDKAWALGIRDYKLHDSNPIVSRPGIYTAGIIAVI